MEAALLVLDSIVMLVLIYMGWRDDRLKPGDPQTSIFRTADTDKIDILAIVKRRGQAGLAGRRP